MSKKVAVILSGCGYLDGAEIRESVLSLLYLDNEGADVSIFAPKQDQHHVLNHLDGSEATSKRNVLEESARIARGKVSDLTQCQPENFDALVLPGGFGVAKNLCSFAFDGSKAKVSPLVKELILGFHSAKKPIGAICISPALVALCLGDKGVEVTIGNDPETAAEIEKLGARHRNCEVDSCVIDRTNKVVTTPAYMYDDAPLGKIGQGIAACVTELLNL